ncbi:hypothetical protein Fmac_033027 [Flemingia macrophylla]|uniref:Senescence-associated protein n=1 Tax=Flemingia macrophylla TaxID=520843 RepID=A0ABD1L6L4_9FABA
MILPVAQWELRFKASRRASLPSRLANGMCLWRGKTNLSHDGLNPAHVPYWWVNNPTLGEFCFTMIGKADIEGSKSNVAMNAWLPQASYPCGNFSDTSSFKFRRTKGSIGHAFTVRIRTRNQNQMSFYPFVPHEISVLVELILGHLRYLLTDVSPQPNSPPDNVFHPDRPTDRGLPWVQKEGSAPLLIHGISKITLKVLVFHFAVSSSHLSYTSQVISQSRTRVKLNRVFCPRRFRKARSLGVFYLDSRQGQWDSLGFPLSVPVLSRLFDARGRGPEGPVPSPSPDRHATTRSRRASSSSSPSTSDGFGTGTPVPSPQSQSFSRGYGSIFPTSLAYIVPSTRGCSPWRPDAVMSTTGRGRHSVLRIFKGRRGRTGHHATITLVGAPADVSGLPNVAVSCHVPICTDERPAQARAPGFTATVVPSYSSGPGPCPNGRVSAQLGTVTQLSVHPTSSILLTKNGPLGALDSVARLNKAAAPSYLFKNSPACSSYPEGNFGGNQLLDGSISLSPLYPSQTNDLHVFSHSNPSQKIRVGRRCNPQRDPANQFLAPYGFTRPLTRTHVRLLGPCFKTGRMGSPQADARSAQVPRHAVAARAAFHNRDDDVSASISTARAWATVTIRIVLFIFPSRYLFAIGLSPVFSLGRNLPPGWGCIPKQPDSPTAPRGETGSGHDGAFTLSGAPFQETWARSATEDASPDYNSDAKGDRFSWWALPGSLAVTKGILTHEVKGPNPTQTCMWPASSFTHPPFRHRTLGRELSFQPTTRQRSREAIMHPTQRLAAGGNDA